MRRFSPAAIVGSVFAAPLLLALALGARTARAAEEDLALDLGQTKIDLRRVVHGAFVQGSAPSEPNHEKDEEPAHPVTITKDFWIGKYPVTRGQFAKFVADAHYVTEAEKGQSGGAGWDGKALVQKKEFTWKNPGFAQTEDHPVVLVTYGDANAFVGWASRKSGKRVRLPTESEWEFAARGFSTGAYYNGGTTDDPVAIGWFKWNAGNGTHPVGQKKPNAFGLFDMSGNVFEWCRDVYAPYHDGPAVDPENVTIVDPERRVLRGGSWLRDPRRARSAARYRNTPGSRNADNGFRIVVSIDEAGAPGLLGAADVAPTGPVGIGGSPVAPGSSKSAGGAATAGAIDSSGGGSRPESISGNDAFSWGLLLASPLAAASAVVAWMLLRKKKSASESSTTMAGVAGATVRASTDGFFARVPNTVDGMRIRYECVVNGVDVSDIVPLTGVETFVYTGSPPSAIRIVEILPMAGDAFRAPARRPQPSTPAAPVFVPPTSPPKPPPLPARASSSYRAPSSHDSQRPIVVPYIDVDPANASDASRSSTTTTSLNAPPNETFLGHPRAY